MADGRHFLTRVTWQQDFPAGQIRKGLLAARFRKEAGRSQRVGEVRLCRPFSTGLRRFPLAPAGLPGGKRRKETLLRKASESTAHVAGFGIQLGGLRPSEPTGKFFDSLWPSASARKPGGRFAFRGLGRSAQGVKQRKAPLAFASAPRRKKVQRAFQGKVGYVQRRKAAFTGQHILIEEGDGVGGGQRCLD